MVAVRSFPVVLLLLPLEMLGIELGTFCKQSTHSSFKLWNSPNSVSTHCVTHRCLQRCVLLLLAAHMIKGEEQVVIVCQVGWNLQLKFFIEVGRSEDRERVSK